MRKQLEQKYEKLFDTYGFERPINAKNINETIRHSLRDFLEKHKNVAIYCNGGHTKMLMSDFIFELKNIKYIVDNYTGQTIKGGFHLIKDEEIEEEGIDAVIISSYKFKDGIADNLKKKHSTIQFLDIYAQLAENGIILHSDYYYSNHPYHHYHTINSIQRKIEHLDDREELEKEYVSLITKYIQIKDFRSAIIYTDKLSKTSGQKTYRGLLTDLETLYEEEKKAAAQIGETNVLLFCMDGLRRQDLNEMPKLTKIFEEKGYLFDNAYSFSTSTYESLIPAYSEDTDLRTEYYKKEFVAEKDCRFLTEAKRQGRSIYFYTDGFHLIEGEGVYYSGTFQSVTEKWWDFILDATEHEHGLYYLHETYESHFTFSNPYTKEKLISEGTAMLFDYLPQKGGKLRTNYEQQHLDALNYLDDVVSPFMDQLKCRTLIYADHGNLVLKEDCTLKEVKDTNLTCAEEWIRIPYIICSPEMKAGRSDRLISIMTLNEIVISMLNKKAYEVLEHNFIKLARSELYNPDFRYLYKMMGKEKYLLPFEAFIFANGYKIVIYSDGVAELYLSATDERITDQEQTEKLIEAVHEYITVCPLEKLVH